MTEPDETQPSSLEEEEEVSEESLHECESDFTLLETDYKNILAKLLEKDELAEFASAYSRLFSAYYELYTSEGDFIQQITRLEIQLVEIKEVIEDRDKNEEVYRREIRRLKREIAKIKQLTDYAHAREQISQEVISNIREQIVKLNNDLELKSRLAGEDEDEKMGELNKTQEGFEREKQRMADEIACIKQKLTNALSYSEELEHKNSAADLKANEMNIVLEQHIGEQSKKQRLIDKLEANIIALNTEIDNLKQTLTDNNNTMDANNKHMSMLETQFKIQKIATEKATKQAEMTQVKLDKCQMELDMLTLEFKDLKEKHTELTKSCRLKNDECNTLRSDVIKLTKQKDNIEKKLMLTERLKYNIQQERDQMRSNVHVMEREIILSKKQSDSDRKTIEGMAKEKEILSKNLMRVQGTIEGHMKLIKIQEQVKFKLEAEIHNLNYEIHQQKKNAQKLEGERNRAISESLDLTQQVEDAMDDINLKQKSIFDLKKMIASLETKLRQQQNLFESVRAARNNLQKEVQEISSEVVEIKEKLKICTHQGQQLKEDIAVKEFLVGRQENIIKKLHRDKESLKVEIQNGLNRIKSLNHEIQELHENEKSLVTCIAERDKTIKKEIEKYDLMMKDRDVIGAQLVRRNDELELLREKINILEVTLVRGESQYNQRVDDIKILKCEIKRLRQEKNYLNKSISNMTDLKTEVFTLERELALKRLKCTALEEELQHPMNIHRWRKLEASDPKIVDLMKKIQIIQRRHVALMSESIQREKQLKESVKMYLNLRQMLARQPGPEMKHELLQTKKALNLRGIKMKCLVSEISMYETQINEYKMDVEKMSRDLSDTKRKYFNQKRLYQNHLGEQIKLPAIKTADASIENQKFTGGGFKMVP